MSGARTEKNRFWWVVLALTAIVVATAPEAAAGDALVARVGEPFEVNGELFPAGELSLKNVQVVSPIATLLEIRVDGDSRGLLLVRSDGDRAVAERDELGFVRAADGHLVLESVAVAGRRVGSATTFDPEAGQWYSSTGGERPIEVASNR